MIDVIYNKWYYNFSRYAGVAELADAPDLGSGALRRGGSSPFSRTNYICTCRCFFLALCQMLGYSPYESSLAPIICMVGAILFAQK